MSSLHPLNGYIRGWTSYYTNSDAQTVGELSKQDNLTYLKLRRWASRRCGSTKDGHQKYWISTGGENWVFATRKEGNNPLRLIDHSKFSCSSTNYVKVKGDKSPFDGDLVYWSTRLGEHPEMPSRKAKLLKRQKGKCPWCGLHFLEKERDVMEVDHKVPKALCGKDEYVNLQLLHRHCHNEKTKEDMDEIRKKETSKFYDRINKFLNKFDWGWVNDIPKLFGLNGQKSSSDNEQHTE